MPEPLENASSEIPPAEKELLAGVDRRIYRAMGFLAVGGAILCWLWRDWHWGAGFAIGAILSAVNFRWMKAAVEHMAQAADPTTHSTTLARPSARGTVARFVLRYALIGAAGYVIFKSSFISLTAFFIGLFLFLAAILVEVAYQIYRGFQKP
ncbi:MAG: ATP synthase subunit I [Acidobacteria bacterium]|nr:ATP synthase subunit I [Acidobacteriota bacterium]